ncbi:hypothetical protein [Streptomyces sp. CA-251251]|uniref:hypothetical protein n=1 Tax=Streptomyces sp. CA-251251 TaxID=3240063 RepID=UPI003D9201F7
MIDPAKAAAGADRHGQGIDEQARAHVVGDRPAGQATAGSAATDLIVTAGHHSQSATAAP